MAVVPLSKYEKNSRIERQDCDPERLNWAVIAAGGSLLASGLLLLTGNRKAGLVTAASGTALVLLDQQETVRAIWDALPGYIDDMQDMLGKVEASVADLEDQCVRLKKVLHR